MAVFVLLGFVVKYPIPGDRDAKRLHYRNLLGVYAKAAHRSPCRTNTDQTWFCLDIVIPYTSLYQRVAGADPRTYRVLGYDDDYWITQGKNDFLGSYAVDRYHFFYGERVVAGVRPEDVQMGNGFAHDGRNIYFAGRSQPGYDPTYERVATGFFKTSAGVFFEGRAAPLPLLDAGTFAFTKDCRGDPLCTKRFAEDQNFRYLFSDRTGPRGWIIEQKPGSLVAFRPLGCGYAVIEGKAYFGLEPIDGADPSTFTALIAMETLYQCREGWYARDRQRAYYGRDPMSGVDVPSFTAFCSYDPSSGLSIYAFDKNRRYHAGRPFGPPVADHSWSTEWTRRFDLAFAHWQSAGATACGGPDSP